MNVQPVGSRKTRRTLRGFFSRIDVAGRTWRQRLELRKFNKDWAKRTPHEQLAAFINILDRHSDLRKAMKEALRLK